MSAKQNEVRKIYARTRHRELKNNDDEEKQVPKPAREKRQNSYRNDDLITDFSSVRARGKSRVITCSGGDAGSKVLPRIIIRRRLKEKVRHTKVQKLLKDIFQGKKGAQRKWQDERSVHSFPPTVACKKHLH